MTIDGKEVSLDLPNKELESLGLDEYSTSPSGASIAVTNEGGGAFRSLIHIPNLESNGEFEFSFSNDMTLSSLPDGGVTVRDNKGDILGTLDAPWAIDATGASVKTWYEIRQSTIVQHVAPTSSTQFPVVADPFWIPFLGIMGGHLTRHALTQMGARPPESGHGGFDQEADFRITGHRSSNTAGARYLHQECRRTVL